MIPSFAAILAEKVLQSFDLFVAQVHAFRVEPLSTQVALYVQKVRV